ncbi:hypothetical protein [Clavibacter michiganensis]|uniref:hypothetical protein n=1 Tax=Clavibacter michiganensis TaxID=28447 RepID=UPI0013050F04|nr:hypothetical protein [Clavibacter michiganensis]
MAVLAPIKLDHDHDHVEPVPEVPNTTTILLRFEGLPAILTCPFDRRLLLGGGSGPFLCGRRAFGS